MPGIGEITGSILPQIIVRLHTVRAGLRVIENTCRIAVLLGKADGIALRRGQLGAIRPAVRSQPIHCRSDIHGFILDAECTPRGIYILADSLNPHSRIVADFRIVLIPLDNIIDSIPQVQPIVASHSCGFKILLRQCDRFARIILCGLLSLFEQGIDGVKHVFCHRPLEFAADALVLFQHHLAVEHFPDVICRHGVLVIPPS